MTPSRHVIMKHKGIIKSAFLSKWSVTPPLEGDKVCKIKGREGENQSKPISTLSINFQGVLLYVQKDRNIDERADKQTDRQTDLQKK